MTGVWNFSGKFLTHFLVVLNLLNSSHWKRKTPNFADAVLLEAERSVGMSKPRFPWRVKAQRIAMGQNRPINEEKIELTV